MSTYKIKFLPEGLEADAAPGESLIDVAAKVALHINASCGGEGVCGRCRVELKEGDVDSKSGPGVFLTTGEYAKGLRLACRSFVNGDATIFIPPDSRADATVYASSLAEAEVSVADLKPMARDLEVELTPPSADDNLADYDRLMAALSSVHGLEKPQMALASLKVMPAAFSDCDFKAWATVMGDTLRMTCSRVMVVASVRTPWV
mgnify:CR=1 FL=1